MSRTLITLFIPFFLAAAVATISVNATYPVPNPATLREVGSGLPACDPNVSQWSGYVDIPGSAGDKHYFYWAFGPRNKNPNAPVLLWMTGGPGCSSMRTPIVENGPCLMNGTTGEIYNNTYSWNNEAYVIYVDQPAGVGFSYANTSDYDNNSWMVADDLYNFLQAFFRAHPEVQNNDLFIVGEGYSGHYIPPTAFRIIQGNKDSNAVPIRLSGIAIQNGLTVPTLQYATYPFVVNDWCTMKTGQPCVPEIQRRMIEIFAGSCRRFSEWCNSEDRDAERACVAGLNACLSMVSLYQRTGANPYDIRKKCVNGNCYNFTAANDFFNRDDVQKSFGVYPFKWESCNNKITPMFNNEWLRNYDSTVASVLKENVRVMIYAGEMDFVCNWIGNKNWTTAMDWSGKEEFNRAPDTPFSTPDGTPAGLVRSVASATSPMHLSFVQVYNAGHMVSMDQPAAGYFLINKFMQNKPLNGQ